MADGGTDWSKLWDAHGPAGDVPALLDRFEADPQGVWSELVDRLCPQFDTAFPASFAALVRLAEIAAGQAPAERHLTLYAAGPIVSCARRTPEGAAVHRTYAPQITRLALLTRESLRLPLGIEDYAGLLQMSLAFEGVEVWDECLDLLAQGEYEVECPYCGVGLFLVIGDGEGDDGAFACSDDHALHDTEKTPLRPAPPGELEGLGRRLHEQALADGQSALARRLTFLFGRGSCSDCRTDFSVAHRVVAHAMPAC
ncbi:hypothetical protein [Streptomyces collinus]|uniref:hypothetical protein n=1 Tax=Streptomyces collinus TaxID=42684 RepID=UPI0036F03AF2